MKTSATKYAFSAVVPWDVDEAIERVVDALQVEGFGVLTRIDVHDVLARKLNINRAPYVILGACNPTLANQAINAEPSIGLLLPCNVVVRTENNRTVIEFMDPEAVLVSLVESDEIAPLAADVRARLERVRDSLIA